tara:strand:- start:265 stop:420 length:156 start_codon:yes stop_codon:yes gene_type:complete
MFLGEDEAPETIRGFEEAEVNPLSVKFVCGCKSGNTATDDRYFDAFHAASS